MARAPAGKGQSAPKPAAGPGKSALSGLAAVAAAAKGTAAAAAAFDDPTRGGNTGGLEGAASVVFDTTHGEKFQPKKEYKQMYRRTRAQFKPVVTPEGETEITQSILNEAKGGIFVLANPTTPFTTNECELLKEFVQKSGSLLVLMSEGGETRAGTNINYLLEEFGIVVNPDCVVRTVYHKYMHPKECLISDGVLNREVLRSVGKDKENSAKNSVYDSVEFGEEPGTPGKAGVAAALSDMPGAGLNVVYPHGTTLGVQKPAVSLLSSGQIAYPMNRPIVAACEREGWVGRVLVCGSASIFSDEWLDKEENSRLLEFAYKYLRSGSNVALHAFDAEEPDVTELRHLSDIGSLAQRLRSCLEESDPLPRDFTGLFDHTLFKLSTDLVPDAVKLYDQLGVKHTPLTLITPQFETPLPQLQPAVFPPALREPAAPALDLFDLDECFAGPSLRLAQLAAKCSESTDEDISYFIHEASSIVGVSLPDAHPLAQQSRDTDPAVSATTDIASALLCEVLRKVVGWKKAASALGGSRYDAAAASDMAAPEPDYLDSAEAQSLVL
ncbi:intraflagellar transport protein 52 [Pycnococcus provasolii]